MGRTITGACCSAVSPPPVMTPSRTFAPPLTQPGREFESVTFFFGSQVPYHAPPRFRLSTIDGAERALSPSLSLSLSFVCHCYVPTPVIHDPIPPPPVPWRPSPRHAVAVPSHPIRRFGIAWGGAQPGSVFGVPSLLPSLQSRAKSDLYVLLLCLPRPHLAASLLSPPPVDIALNAYTPCPGACVTSGRPVISRTDRAKVEDGGISQGPVYILGWRSSKSHWAVCTYMAPWATGLPMGATKHATRQTTDRRDGGRTDGRPVGRSGSHMRSVGRLSF